DMDIQLVAPDGTVYDLILDRCGGYFFHLNICFSNKAGTNVTSAVCPGSGGEMAGNYIAQGNWTGLNGEGINGNWTLRFTDDSWALDPCTLFGWNIEIKKTMTVSASPIPGVNHGDLHIINNDPFKYGSQVFWLTPVTFINYNGTTLTSDSCYDYGTPVKITLLERVTTPTIITTCAAPGDGSNGVTIRVTSPTGGMPGLPSPTAADTFRVVGSGAASGIVFPTRPVGESELSNSFTVLDGQAWNVRFVDNNGCESEIGGTYNQPNLGALQIDTNVCDGATVAFSTTNPIPLFSQYRVLLDFDSYPQDVSWFIYDGNNQVVASGGGYGTTVGAATYTTPATINPNNGPYRFVLYDGFDDGFGSGGGSTNNGGLNTLNFIRVVEVHADGTVDTLFSQNYAFCTPIYCVGPTASVFGQLDIPLGTPNGTFSTGVSVSLENNRTCTGTAVAGAITMNQDGTGTVNTNAAGVNAGSSYSVQYQYTDQYGCVKQICGPLDVFPNITLAPTVNCATSPPTVSVNATCTGCNATYVAEYSYNGTTSWTTSTTGNFQDLYIFAHVKNVSTGVIGCEVQSTKLGTCATVLPIEFIYAKAEPVNNEYIKVSWATASEYNSDRFDIWRSEDGINFAKVGTVPASGNATQQRNYFYDDYRVQKGITYYYKIIEVDMDSREQHSNVVNAKLTIDALEVTGIYPNPVKESATIEVQAKEKDNLQMIVYNDLGQIMLQQDVELKAGTNSIVVDMKTWANGIYYFNLKNDNIKPIIKKVLKKD
ncbi:MAG TPA: T9SS type A sorting domain-containing protein, partial [Chitinophagales bacterium]|nr:T9SS type A sorting domain-containing protein [Chitinophagales bacterium]